MSDINKFTTKEVLNKVLLDSSGNAVNAFSHTTQEALNAALDDDNSRLNVNLVGGTIGGDVTINGDLTVNGDGVGAYDEIISGGLVINVTDGQNVKGLHITQLDAGEWTSMMEAVAYGLLIRSTANDTTPAFKVQGNGTSNEVLSALSNGNVGIGTASPDHNLDIVSSGNAEFELTRTSGASIFMQSQSAKGLIGTSSNHSLNFLTNGGTRLTIDTSGNLTVSSGSAIQFGDSSYKIIGSTVGNYLRFFTESTQALQIDDSQKATFAGNVKITKAESSASEFISALEINRDYGSATATDLLTGMIFTDDNSVQAGIFTNRYNSAGNYNSRLQFYVNSSSSSMTPATALGDPALIINESKNATFAGRVAISSAFTAGELLGVKGSVGSDWGARIENTSSTGAGALIKSATTNAGVQLFQVRSGSENAFTIMGDKNTTFAGSVKIQASSIGTADTNSNDLVIEGSANRGMSILAGDTHYASIMFGDAGNPNAGRIRYLNTDNTMRFVTNDNDRFIIDGNSRISLSNNDSGTSNTVFGKLAGASIDAGSNYNTFIGENVADASLDDAIYNSAVGYSTLSALTSGDYNTAIGSRALLQVNSGSQNTALGYYSGYGITTGNNNVHIGALAGEGNTGASYLVGIGDDTFRVGGVTSGANGAVAVGYQALRKLTSGGKNVAVGYLAGSQITTGDSNIALGHQAMDEIISGDRNIAIGHNAIGNAQGGATSGDSKDNIAIGFQSQGGAWADAECLKNTSIGSYSLDGALNGALQNTALGYASLGAVTQGDNNVAVGMEAGDNITTGTKNVTIGQQARTSAVGATNQIVIGATATGAGDNSVVLGNSDVTAVLCASDGEAQVYASAIRFPATQVANSNANALDDYEEGLHTPTIVGSSSGNYVLNTSFDNLSYTKIGRQVTLTGEIRIASDNSTSGELRFSLPFATADLTETANVAVSTNVHLSAHGNADIDDNKLLIYITEGSSFFRIAHIADDDTFTWITHTSVDGAWNVTLTLTYFTS